MGYQALLFCPDEKTARTVTQVLGDLEFSVETCAEPFAAVKKLMSQHFDALVVDCDNEQNATLLFKSARNSTSNQASLAVAVVEGQAGVAKAFRIGANLVLTKPINVEQAKGTLRVARGLLRKGEPGKPAAAAPAQTTAAPVVPAAKPVAPKASSPQPVAPPKPVAPTAVPGARSPLPPVPRPAASPLPPRAAAANIAPPASAANDDDLLEINIDDAPEAPAAKAPPTVKLPPQIPSPVAESKPVAKVISAAPAFGGAAAAPAPAREVQPAPAVEAIPAVTEPQPLAQPEASDSDAKSAPGTPFTFGGAAVESEPSGPNNKVLIGIAAAVVVLIGIYVGWSYISASSSRTPANPAPVTASQPVKPVPAPSKPATTPAATSQPAASAPSSQTVSQPVTQAALPKPKNDAEADQPASDENDVSVLLPATKSSDKSSPVAPSKSAPAPLMVKGGAAPTIKKAPATPDAPAPSMIGLATPTTNAPPINLEGNSGNGLKPVLQTLNISQGVSQGLLIKKVQPTYPQNAMAMHVEGAVNLLATISKSGNITAVKVLGGPVLLTHAAVDAVKQWKYKPYQLNGEPVEIQTQITVNFKLPN